MRLYNTQKIALVFASVVMAAGLMMLSLHITPAITYADFIAGHITWTDGTKFQDLIVMPITIVGSTMFLIFLFNLLESINRYTERTDSENASLHICYWSIPAFATICSSILHKNFDSVFLQFPF